MSNFKAAERSETTLFKRLHLLGIRNRLERDWGIRAEEEEDMQGCLSFQTRHDMRGGEIFFVPDRRYYSRIFAKVKPGEVVLDAGAGDLRFALALATKVKKVYAVEINPKVLGAALTVIGYDLPSNVIPICADAFEWPVPADVTIVTCIMIHRTHDFPPDWLLRRIVYADFHKGVCIQKPLRRSSHGTS